MIGLFSNKNGLHDGFFNKYLLRTFDQPVFNYIFKLNSLFPPILKKNILNLSNFNRFLPVNCAVDDLEFYQDENSNIYDLLSNPQFYSAGEYGATTNPSSFETTNQQVTIKTEKKEPFSFKYPSGRQPQVYQTEHIYYDTKPIDIGHQIYEPTEADTNVDSHFNLNIIGSDNYYFNDFKPHQDSMDYYSSSNESYISPLDEELFKKRDQPPHPHHSHSHHNGFEQYGLHNPSITSVDFDLQSEITDLSESIELPFKQEKEVAKTDKKRKITSNANPQKKVKLEDEDEVLGDLKFECSFCNARFKVKGYLTRHLKKHQSLKAFKCPFYSEDASDQNHPKGTKCHPSGGFSRRDTFKTHLKALHFIYPPGTKSNERSLIGGRCAGCFKYFKNNHEWLETHIEKKQCTGTCE